MKKFSIVLLFALLANFVSAEVVKTVNNLVAGTLSTVLTATEKTTVTKLIVTGKVDFRDFNCMRDEMTVLADVDLFGTSISAYSGGGGSYSTGEIPASAFIGKSSLKSFLFPSYATSIGDAAFRYCSGLTSMKIDSVVSYIGYNAFEECTGLASLTLSDMLRTIKSFAFQGCTALSGTLTLPNPLAKIYDNAFNGCTGLTGVVFGSSIDSLGSQVFGSCTALKTIRFMGTSKVMLSSGTFSNIASGSIIYVPAGCSAMLVNNSSWDTGLTKLYEYRVRVSSQSAIKQSMTTVKLTGSLDYITEFPVLMYGFCWSRTNPMPTISDSLINIGTSTTVGNFFSNVSTLTAGVFYYIRAFALDQFGAAYGKQISYNTPAMPATAGTIAGKSSVSQGQNNVTYTVPTISNATTYVWSLPTGATGTSTTNSITVSFAKTATSGTISVFGRNANGDGVASALYVTVNATPKSAGVISGSTVLCQGEKQVSYTVPPIEDATTYVWRLPSGCTGSSTTNTILVNYTYVSVSGTISVYGKNDWGTGDSSMLEVTVHQLPSVELDEVVLAYGSTLTLTPRLVYSEGSTLKYKWTPATGLSNDSILNPVVMATGTVWYTLTVTTPYGCTTSRDFRVSLKAMDKPVIGIVGIVNGKNRIAWNKPVSQGIASYLIYKETVSTDVYEKIGTVPYDSLSVFVDASSVPDVKSSKYKISVLDKGGMESPQSDAHKTMHLSINKGQNSTWNLIWEPYEGFKPSTYNIYRGTSPTSLNFLDATSASSTQYTDLEAPAGNVYYQLEVISPNLVSPSKVSPLRSVTATYNSSRSNVAAGILNGLDETTTALRMYPNPVNDVLNIEAEGASQVTMMDLTGQVLYSGEMNSSTVLNTSTFKPGMYVVKVKVGKGYVYKKVLKN
jgi:hypothetical protein